MASSPVRPSPGLGETGWQLAFQKKAPSTSERRNPPPIDVIAPEVLATPSDVRGQTEGDILWWQPGWHDAARFVGYRWVFLTPALALLLVIVWFFINRGMRDMIAIIGIKLLLLSAAVAISLAGYVIRRAVQARSEPFCIFCGYNLTSLPDNYRCPECGRPYTWALIAEYRRDPRWFIERWKSRMDIPPPAAPFAAGPHRRRKRARDGTE